jgi:hypothetical protein
MHNFTFDDNQTLCIVDSAISRSIEDFHEHVMDSGQQTD